MRPGPFPFDHHVHAWYSGDTDVPLAERGRTARGPRPHGISEHFPSPRLPDDDAILRYLDEARRLGLAVALEYDLGVAPALRPSTRDALDYLIGGVHQVRVGAREISYDDAGSFLKRRVDAYAGATDFRADPALSAGVLAAIVRVLESSFARDRVDVLAHPTFSPIAALGDPEHGYPAEWQDEVIALCVRHGVAIEVNESYRVPHQAFALRARAAGARFAVGSDSHEALLPLDYTMSLVAAADLGTRLRAQALSGSSASSS